MPQTWAKDVYSSNVQAIAYDAEAQEMIVTWMKGKRSAYSGVPEEVAWEAANAASVGTFLNTEIKNKYGHRYI